MPPFLFFIYRPCAPAADDTGGKTNLQCHSLTKILDLPLVPIPIMARTDTYGTKFVALFNFLASSKLSTKWRWWFCYYECCSGESRRPTKWKWWCCCSGECCSSECCWIGSGASEICTPIMLTPAVPEGVSGLPEEGLIKTEVPNGIIKRQTSGGTTSCTNNNNFNF